LEPKGVIICGRDCTHPHMFKCRHCILASLIICCLTSY